MVDTIGMANSAPTATTLQFNGRQARQLNGVGFAGATAARPLGTLTGVRPGTSVTTVTATATTWSCGPMSGLADVMVAAESGGYPWSCDGVVGGSLTPNNPSLPRKDIVVVTITDPENGSTTPTVTRSYVAGTVNVGGVLTSVLPARSFTVAEINMPASSGAPSVTWVAPYIAGAGGLIHVLTTALRDAGTWQPNQQILLLADMSIQTYTGARWLIEDTQAQAHTPTFNNFTLGNSTFDCWSQRHGLQRHYFGSVKLGTTSALGSSPTLNLLDALPAKFGVAGSNYIVGHLGMLSRGVAFYTGDVYSQASTTLVQLGTRGTNSSTGSITPTAPFTWKSTDEISWDFWAPIA